MCLLLNLSSALLGCPPRKRWEETPMVVEGNKKDNISLFVSERPFADGKNKFCGKELSDGFSSFMEKCLT